MPLIAIVGAGPIGSALAHKLAARSRVREVRFIDPDIKVAQGKALDIVQSGPIENFGTRVTATGSIHGAAGADAIALADPAAGQGEHAGEAGLALVRQLRDAGIRAPLVFAGGAQRELMSRAASELHVPGARLVGAAPLALESALRALCGLAADQSGAGVSLSVAGVPPKHTVIAWEEATVSGQPLTAVVPPHEIAALAARVAGLWPPGPYALGTAAARIVEALCHGSRRRFSCFVDVGRGRIVSMPAELGRGGVKRVIEPALTRLERTALETAIESV